MTWVSRVAPTPPTTPATGSNARIADNATGLGVDVQDLLRLTGTPARPAGSASTRYGLSKGSNGEEVRQLQANLRALGYFKYPSDTGYYGEGTEIAVLAFKRKNGLAVNGVADAETLDRVAQAASELPSCTPTGHRSELHIAANIQPRSHSTIPGFQGQVEQSAEFLYRYYMTAGKPYPTLGQPYSFLMSGRDANGAANPRFERNFNGGEKPPVAGDILVAKGTKPGEFHSALITRVEGNEVTVLQSNVPKNWQGAKETCATFTLVLKDGKFAMPALPLGQKGFDGDMSVVGWIHPTGPDALPRK
jgi:peptidoglycan hydrolase-like protein with peptidoglycan-binding domain